MRICYLSIALILNLCQHTKLLFQYLLQHIQIMEKHSSPKFPTTKHLLEDFSDSEFMPQKYSKDLSLEDEELQTAYSCFLNIRQLDKDIKQHSNFNCKLEELNQKLVENIASLKAQGKKK